MFVIVVYIPESHLEDVKEAMFSAGGGRYENYDKCSWQVLGTGQFHPLEGSNPFIGQPGEVEQVAEYRVEMICEEKYLKQVFKALKKAHPYEEPAYHAYAIKI